MVTKGIEGKQEMLVREEFTAKAVGSGTVMALATPMMVALLEKTCRLSVKPYLEEGQETVGTHVDVSHDNAVPVGKRVWCESEVVDVDRRRISFKVSVYDDNGLVGQGTHERFIIDERKFSEKLETRKREYPRS